jgi:hypothetical protein
MRYALASWLFHVGPLYRVRYQSMKWVRQTTHVQNYAVPASNICGESEDNIQSSVTSEHDSRAKGCVQPRGSNKTGNATGKGKQKSQARRLDSRPCEGRRACRPEGGRQNDSRILIAARAGVQCGSRTGPAERLAAGAAPSRAASAARACPTARGRARAHDSAQATARQAHHARAPGSAPAPGLGTACSGPGPMRAHARARAWRGASARTRVG